MGSTIQNVVVSPSGASYGVQLADNSTMVLSVVDLLPTANIAGLQANVISSEDSIESVVRRVEEEPLDPAFIQRTPAAISPSDPSRLIIGVSQIQEVSHSKPLSTSGPFLQTFDLGSGNNISRQALTRANLTSITATPDAHRVSEPRTIHMKLSSDGNWLATVDEWMPPKRDVEFFSQLDTDLDEEQRDRREVFLKFWQWSEEEQTWELVSRINNPHAFEDGSGAPRILDLASDPSSLRFSTIGEDGYVRTWTTKTRKRDGIIVRSEAGLVLRNWHCQHAVATGKPSLETPTAKPQRPIPNGSVAFSEDGSLLAAATGDTGILHLLDPQTGTIRSTRTHMFAGPILALAFLSHDLITVSNVLHLHDLISDSLRYTIPFSSTLTSLTTCQKREMLHLATDPTTHTFALALPARIRRSDASTLSSYFSELAVFTPDSSMPVLQERCAALVTALIPNAGGDGYLVLDSAAEVRMVLRKNSQAVTALAQSEAALRLEGLDDEPVVEVEAEAEEEIEEDVEVTALEEDDGEEDETPVVTQQQLSEIFDIGPSFAMPPMEEMFYQVAGLFSSLPAVQSV
jgi:NET1-associated nuclear protein 1 (U3 small nucleolar RNA-associated protein 17)